MSTTIRNDLEQAKLFALDYMKDPSKYGLLTPGALNELMYKAIQIEYGGVLDAEEEKLSYEIDTILDGTLYN